MPMSHIQVFNIFVILFVGLILPIFHFFTPMKRTNSLKVTALGGVCSIFGIAAACMTGKNCLEVVTLIDAAGFGRAYVFGLGIVLAGVLIGLAKYFNEMHKGLKR